MALALGLILPASASAATFVVNSNADTSDGMCDAANCTLREAIVAANGNGASDTITFDLDAGAREILLNATVLTISNDMADPDLTIDGDLDGDGTPDITVDAQGGSRVFLIASGAEATLEGLVITGGAFSGGGILNDGGTLTVTNSTFSGNSAGYGGGIRNDNGTLIVTNSTFSGNYGSSGGIHNNAGTLTVTDSTFSGNTGYGYGGGIVSAGPTTVTNTTFSANNASYGGGIANDYGGTLTVTN
ncbi:MAG: CSLREA domain-containing protein, partial [Planctomycetaceae bacterium]